MGIVAAPARSLEPTTTRSQRPLYCAAALYAIVVAAAVWRHEPWTDEAQSWLLARDATLIDLWIRLLHYEGSPGLWHTLLHVFIELGAPYQAINILSAAIGFVGSCLLLWKAPLPMPIRVVLPFTFYLCYQYSVIARSYVLLPILLFACAALYKSREWRLELFTVLLILMAAASVHGFVLSLSIWIGSLIAAKRELHANYSYRRKQIIVATLYLSCLILIAISAWPARDVAFVTHANFSLRHLLEVSVITIREAFTGEWISSLAVLALSAPFLWRGGGWLIFLLSGALLCGVAAAVYTQVWHFGLVFIAWLFAIWISAGNARPGKPVLAAIIIVSVIQCYWTFKSIRYDWRYPYSGALEAARFLDSTGIVHQRVYGTGFACTAIQPYFSRNVFANVNGGRAPAYWDWSAKNRADEITEQLLSRYPDYLFVGYKRPADKKYWANLAEMSAYEPVRHFEGSLFWRDRILESEAFDLYKRGQAGDVHTVSVLNMADQASARQLVSGFYALESEAWRWTARDFSAALKPPPNGNRDGATLVLNLVIPEVQIQRLGPMTLHASVGRLALKAETFSKPGRYIYSRHVPAGALGSDTILVAFSFDKAAPPSGLDARELGAVVTSVMLIPN